MESEAKPFVSVSLFLREMCQGVSNVIKAIFQFRKWRRPRPPPFTTRLPANILMATATYFTLLLVLISTITPFVFLAIPYWRLLELFTAGAGGGKHGGGLHGSGGGGGGENSQGGSLKTALVIFYGLVLAQGGAEIYLIFSTLATKKPYFRYLQQEYNFPDWGAEALGRYLLDAVEKCKRSPASIRDWNLFRHASELLGSESWEDYVNGLRVLGILVRQGLFRSGSSQSQCVVASRPKVDKLIDTLADVDVTRSEARELAATVVADLANGLQLARFPGAIQCVASLLETSHGGGEGATTASNELVLQGLTILDRLALDHHNCREICSAPGLLPKITAPLYSHTLIQEVIGMPPRASVVSKSLRVVHRLIRAPGETGARLRREICADEQAVSNIEGILGLAVADEAAVAADGEQAMQLASKRRKQESSDDVLHMKMRSASLPHPTYEEMIVQALTEMRDPSGSSRRTISMYIADHFSGIDNDDLLSYNLHRLVSQGHLRRGRGIRTGNYLLEKSVEHEKTLGDLQMLGMEILTELALDSLLNLSEITKRNLINTQLRIFLACDKGTEPVTKVQTSGRTLALLLHCCLPNSLPITDLNDNICHLTGILDDKNNKIIYRTIAAWILEGLCVHHDIDDQLIKETVLPKVVTMVPLSCDKARGRIVTKNRGPQGTASQRTITSPGDDEEKQNGQGDPSGASDEQAAIKELQEALLSLTLKLCKVVGEDTFTQVVQNEISGEDGTFALILKTIVEQNNKGKPTPNSLRIVKLCGQIAVSTMQCNQYTAHMDHNFVVSVTTALENMSELESSMLVTGTNCRMKKTIRPLLFEIEKELKKGLDLVG